MTSDSVRLEVLAAFDNEMQAAVIVEALADRSIRAQMVGGYTAGFRAEAPGFVKVLVDAADLATAREVLAEWSDKADEIDWSSVDFGDDSPLSAAEKKDTGREDADSAEASKAEEDRPFQFSIANLLLLQAVVCILLALWKGLPGAVAAVLLVTGGMAVLALGGVVRIGSDLSRGRQEAIYLIRIAFVVAIIYLVSVVALMIL